MKKIILFPLFCLLLLASCATGNPPMGDITLSDIETCASYIEHKDDPAIQAELDVSGMSGQLMIADVSCEGIVDYKEGVQFNLGLLVGDERIGLTLQPYYEKSDTSALEELNGQKISVTGDLHTNVMGPNGVTLAVDPSEF